MDSEAIGSNNYNSSITDFEEVVRLDTEYIPQLKRFPMDTLIFISYEAATSLIPVLAILIILYLKDHRKTDHLHFSSCSRT